MDWMYDGRQVQKEDYLLGKKVDKNFGETTDNDSLLPPKICPSDSKFSQVDMTKKILEDPLVNIKKREIECTQKILQNPMRLKKKQNVQLEKHTIEDHQLDMILVSRLKSYEKAGLDLAKILSITKHKEKKEHKRKQKKSKLSSEEDEVIHNKEKSTNKQKKYDQKSNNFKQVDKKHNDKQSFEYRDHKHDGNKNRNETYRSESSLDYVNLNKKGKFANESNKYYRNKDNNRRYEGRRSLSKEKHQGSKEENWEKNNPNYEQEAKQRKKLPSDSKRHRSVSSNEELEQKKKKDFEGKNNTSKQSKPKSNNHHNTNSPDRKQQSQVSKDSRSLHRHSTNFDERRSRSGSPRKEKQYKKSNKVKKRDRNRQNSSSSSNSGNEGKHINVAKQTSKHQHNLEVQLGSEEHVLNEKDSFKNKKNFGLFVPKGQSVKKSSHSPPPVKLKKNVNDVQSKLPLLKKKKLTEKEMESMRKEMMDDAKKRDKERSLNVKRYRKEDEKEEETLKPYSKEFLIKQLAHAASQVSVERSIKSNINKLQKNDTFTK